MPVNDTTTNQGYQKPNIANQLSDDVGRLRSALDSIDTDMAARLAKAGGVMTGPLGVPGGTAAAPSVYFTGDTNTGLFSPGADTLDVTTGGTSKVRVDSTTSPLKELYGGTHYPVVTQVDIGTAAAQIPLNSSLGQLAFLDEVSRWRAAGTAPTNNLDINFEYVSDTSIKIRMRGSDGTVRSTTLTLS